MGILRQRPLDLRIHVPGDIEEILQAVVIQVRQACAPFHVAVLDRQPRGGGHVLEQAFAEVAIQGGNVVGEVRLEQIEQAIAVVVADRHAHARLRVAVFAVGGAAFHAPRR